MITSSLVYFTNVLGFIFRLRRKRKYPKPPHTLTVHVANKLARLSLCPEKFTERTRIVHVLYMYIQTKSFP